MCSPLVSRLGIAAAFAVATSGFAANGQGQTHGPMSASASASASVRAPLAVLAQVPARASARAPDPAPEPAAALVGFASEAGVSRLARSGAKRDFPLLANQFEAQSNAAFCGPATAAIVLNAVRGRSSPDLPRDRSRLRAEDLANLPPGLDPTIPRHTQESVVARGAKPRAQVLGEPVNGVDGKPKRDFGYQLRQFDEMLRAHGLATRLAVVDEARTDAEVRADLAAALERGDYVVVNYRREAVGQRGGGHISPLGAYDGESDSFLVLDVNPGAASWVWMPATTLAKGMRTFDTVENRGYVVIDAR